MKVRIKKNLLEHVVKIFKKGDFRNEFYGGRIPVILKAEGERLEILAVENVGNLHLAVWISAGVAGPGRITVDLRSLEDTLKRIASEEIELGIVSGRLNLVADDLISSIVTEDDLEIDPSVMAKFRAEETQAPEVSAEDFARALEICIPSLHRAMSRLLSGLYLDMEGELLRTVASDGLRLSLVEIPVSAPVEPVIVPRRVCVLLREILKRFPGGKVGIVSGAEEIVFFGESWILRAIPNETIYPDYRVAIPKEGLRMIVRAEEFEEVMKRFSKKKGAVVEISPVEGKALRIELRDEETSFGTEISAEFEVNEVPECVMVFDPPHLAQVVKNRSVKLVIHATKKVVAFQFGNYPGDLELVAPYWQDDRHDFPETGPFSPLPSIEELSRWRVEIPKRSGRRTFGRTSGTVLSTLKKRISELERENETLRAEIERLRIENEHLRRGEVPLEPFSEGGMKAVFGGKVLVLRNGVIFESNGNGGKPVGRYDRKTGFGLIEDRPIRLRRNGHGWTMLI